MSSVRVREPVRVSPDRNPHHRATRYARLGLGLWLLPHPRPALHRNGTIRWAARNGTPSNPQMSHAVHPQPWCPFCYRSSTPAGGRGFEATRWWSGCQIPTVTRRAAQHSGHNMSLGAFSPRINRGWSVTAQSSRPLSRAASAGGGGSD